MLCYSTGSLPDAFSLSENLPEIADLLSQTPFTGVELVVTAPMLARAGDTGYWNGIRDSFRAKGLVFRNIHMGAPHLLGPEAHRPGLSALDADARARKVAAIEAGMQIAMALEAPHLTLTTGLTESEAQREVQIEGFREALMNLVMSKPVPLKILIEQEPEHIINRTAQLIELGRAFPGQVYATFDVGHSHVLGEDIGDSIRRLGPLLRNVHLEDIAGRVHKHLLYGEGDVDFDSIFTALHDIGYRGDYTPDLYPFKDDHARAMRESLEFLRRHGVLTRAL
jgi:sugar phosphate isomerase/epimerase